jgi:dTDP-glucose pyrophosphorylase
MNVLFLMAGADRVSRSDDAYPVYLTEIGRETILQKLIKSVEKMHDINFIFMLKSDDIRKYRVDNSIKQLCPAAKVFPVQNETAGAACTALLASGLIDNAEELLILNSDDWADVSHSEVVSYFKRKKLDAGTVVFESIHPRYSYVRIDNNGFVTEAAEKNPISNNATAGIYWYARGSDFVKSAKASIRKGAELQGRYYICPCFNEMILEQMKIQSIKISADIYHPIKNNSQLLQSEISNTRGII